MRCPDCGKSMPLRRLHDKWFLMCGRKHCHGKHQADRWGNPLGVPIDRQGRKKRYWLHKNLDKLWTNKDIQKTWLLDTVGEKHISVMDHKQLDKCQRSIKKFQKNRQKAALYKMKIELEVDVARIIRSFKMYVKNISLK